MNSSIQLCIRTVPDSLLCSQTASGTWVSSHPCQLVVKACPGWAYGLYGGNMDSHRGPGDVLASALLHLHWKMSLYSSDYTRTRFGIWGLMKQKKKKLVQLVAVSVIFLLLLLIILSAINSKPRLISHSKSTWLSFYIDHWNYTVGSMYHLLFI